MRGFPVGDLQADAGKNGERPNILYIMTDQQYAGAMSCAGNTHLKTPAMDSLAADGVAFERSYCAFPLCVPSRAAMVTGRMPHEFGIEVNVGQRDVKVEAPTMGALLGAAGYECVYFGKWHLPIPTGDVKTHGFRILSDKGDGNCAEACAAFLKQKHEKPFLAFASFVNPHDICQHARGEKFPQGPIPEPPPPDQCPPLPDNLGIPEGEPQALRKIQALCSKKIYPTDGWPPERWRQYRWAYYRLTEKVDAQVGIILNALRESGLEGNTVVIFSSDHGDGHGAHRWNQKQILYEEVARVPFIVSWKGVTKAGLKDRGHLVSSGLDLLPTMCDYAGISTPEGLTGASVREIAEGGRSAKWRDYVVTETAFSEGGDFFGVRGRMVRSGRFKYIAYSCDGKRVKVDEGWKREQLFDLEKDPGEMKDLASYPAHSNTLAEHRKMLAEWIRRTGDQFHMPEGT